MAPEGLISLLCPYLSVLSLLGALLCYPSYSCLGSMLCFRLCYIEGDIRAFVWGLSYFMSMS